MGSFEQVLYSLLASTLSRHKCVVFAIPGPNNLISFRIEATAKQARRIVCVCDALKRSREKPWPCLDSCLER